LIFAFVASDFILLFALLLFFILLFSFFLLSYLADVECELDALAFCLKTLLSYNLSSS